jgi:hypothetical protein
MACAEPVLIDTYEHGAAMVVAGEEYERPTGGFANKNGL